MHKDINQNQRFYGALKALTLLPGGTNLVKNICDKHQKQYPNKSSFDNDDKDRIDISKQEQYLNFFEALYNYLKDGGAPNDPIFDTTSDGILPINTTYDGVHSYLSLKITIGWDNSDSHRCPEQRPRIRNNFFTPALEYAVNKSGISRELVSKHVRVHLYNNGTILTQENNDDWKTFSVSYPGSIDPNIRYIDPNIDDFRYCPKMTIVQYFRRVDLKGEQSFKSAYRAASGKIIEWDKYIKKGAKYAIVTQTDLADGQSLNDVSDEDIINLTGHVQTNYASDGDYYSVGYTDKCIQSIENTEILGLYKQTNTPIYVMKLEEPIHISTGPSYRCLAVGDMLTLMVNEYRSTPSVILQSTLDKGIYELVPMQSTRFKPNKPRTNRLN